MSAPATQPQAGRRWAGAWLDLAAFAGGLAVAWGAGWSATDLVWSLWLASFCVGYALILWTLSAELREFGVAVWRDRTPGMAVGKAVTAAMLVAGFLFGLVFFTVHFGGFHYVHSVFLQQFFPIETSAAAARRFPGPELYGEVIRRYWMFVPMAFLAERAAFRRKEPSAEDTAVTAEAIARRKRNAMNAPMMAPYKNVIRMHLLIFFFAAAHFLRFEHFAVYAVVYAAYFFPWRVLREGTETGGAETA